MSENLSLRIKEVKENIYTKNIKEIVHYDTKEEWKNCKTRETIYTDKNPLFRISQYKRGKRFDCDVALRTMVLHTMAYPHVNLRGRRIDFQKGEKHKFEIENNEIGEYVYRSDTMNSYYTMLNEYLRLFGDDRTNPQLLKKMKDGKLTYGNWGSWENCILENKQYFENLLPEEAMKFLSVVHTIGNFIPVPFKKKGEEFNSPRGWGNKKINDYWDLTLLAIYNWYMKKNNKKVLYDNIKLITVVKTKESEEMCEKWLGEFKDDNGKCSWDKFVEDNYMQDFVNVSDSKESYGIPKELFGEHFKKTGLPTDKDKFIQFFSQATEWIIARGERIACNIKSKKMLVE